MVTTYLHEAGFFSISWTVANPRSGTTYVRPSAREVLRVFVPTAGEEIEVYSGNLFEGKLLYRGPVRTEADLLRLLENVPYALRVA